MRSSIRGLAIVGGAVLLCAGASPAQGVRYVQAYPPSNSPSPQHPMVIQQSTQQHAFAQQAPVAHQQYTMQPARQVSQQPVAQAPSNNAAQQPEMSKEDQQIQQLLAKLTELSNRIGQDANAPGAYRLQLSQAEVMLQLAAYSKGKEREDWLKASVDAYFSAAVSSPENDQAAYQSLQALPAQISRSFPESKVATYAILQEIQADYMRVLVKTTDDPAKAQLHLRDRLIRFAQEYPDCPEAPKAVMEAAEICETLKRIEDARKCYRYVAVRYAGTPLARKAQGIEWRLSEGAAQVTMELPYVYATSARGDSLYDIKDARGKVVVIYFWTTQCPEAHGDFASLKVLTDRYQFKGLEVVYVNLDDDPLAVREFLAGKLTGGVHLHQKGGLDSETAQRYGIKSLPEAFLVGKDGVLIKHSLKVGDLEREVSKQLSDRK